MKFAQLVRFWNGAAPLTANKLFFSGSSLIKFTIKAGIMILESINNVKLYQLLFFIDKDLAEQIRVNACPFCGASLHTSNYFRKPRGGPENIPELFSIRHSLCCSAENCRRRVLPPSLRFWDRKVYWSIVILVTIVLQQNRTDGYSAGRIMRLVGISRHTLKRWIHYFKEVFPQTRRWKRIRGRIGVEIDIGQIPSAIILFFIEHTGSVEDGLIRSLQLFSGGIDVF